MARRQHSPARRPRAKVRDRGHLVTAVVMLALAAVGAYGLYMELSSDFAQPSEVAAAVLLLVLCGSIGLLLLVPHRLPGEGFPPVLLHTLGWLLSLAFLAFGAVLLADPRAATDPGSRHFSSVGGTLYIGGVMLIIGLVGITVLVVSAVRRLRLRGTEASLPAPPPKPGLTPKQRRRQRKRHNRTASKRAS